MGDMVKSTRSIFLTNICPDGDLLCFMVVLGRQKERKTKIYVVVIVIFNVINAKNNLEHKE